MECKDCPQSYIQKEYNELGKGVSLLLRICRPIIVSGKDCVLESGFCVAKFITELKSKVVYAKDLIKKRRCFPKEVPGDLIDTHFKDKEVGDVGMI